MVGLFVLVLFGLLLAIYPWAVFLLAVTAALAGVAIWYLSRLTGLQVWQVVTLATLGGYVVLNYGFANLAFRIGGIPVIAGHMLMLAALGLAVAKAWPDLDKALREPATVFLLGLVLLAGLHLVVDIPRYGMYALRDSSVFIESIFLLLGYLWARREKDLQLLLKWFLLVVCVNLIYTLAFPWEESLQAWSPQSGIFLEVPVVGFHVASHLYLLTGALFCLWVAKHVVGWPSWLLLLLAGAQLFGLTIMQARSMYVGLAMVLVVALFFGQFWQWGKVVVILPLALGLLLLLTTSGLELSGRVGPVNASFLQKHVRSLLLKRDAPSVGTLHDRWSWYRSVWQRVQSSPTNLFVGEGFGQPLIDFHTRSGVAVRQPHNVHLTVLARLGVLGVLLWIGFHLSLVWRFLAALRQGRRIQSGWNDLFLWLFFYYLLAMLLSSVQPFLEFSYGAIPFYFMVGFSLALLRWRLGESEVTHAN